MLKKSNEIALEFEGIKSRIDIETSRNKNAGRGSTYQIVHKSESSRFQFPKDVNLGIANAVPDLPGTMIFDETTANGMNFYYDDVQKSIRGVDGYDFIFIPWFLNPEYSLASYEVILRDSEEIEISNLAKSEHGLELSDAQINWRRFAIEHKCGGDKKLFCQEYPSSYAEAFIFSGRPRFDMNVLQQLRNNSKAVIKKEGLLNFYKDIDPYARYIIGVDTSEGKIDGDKSSAIFLNAKTFSIDAEYNGLLEPEMLSGHLASWGRLFNEALIVVESNNHGLAVLNDLKKIYNRIYFRKQFDKISAEWKELIGWQTNMKTKPIMVGNLATALKDGLTIPSHEIIDELMTFIYNDDGSMSASEGKHDDRVMALACAVQGYLETFQKSIDMPNKNPAKYSLSWYEKMDEHIDNQRRQREVA